MALSMQEHIFKQYEHIFKQYEHPWEKEAYLVVCALLVYILK